MRSHPCISRAGKATHWIEGVLAYCLDGRGPHPSHLSTTQHRHFIVPSWSRESPTMQGNSVLGLAGLANAISTKNEPPAGGCDASMQFSSKKNWLGKVADTIMTVLDGNFKPTGRPFRWCQRVGSLSFDLNVYVACQHSVTRSLHQMVTYLDSTSQWSGCHRKMEGMVDLTLSATDVSLVPKYFISYEMFD